MPKSPARLASLNPLIKWNLEFSNEIANRRFLEVEEMLERYQLMHTSRLKTFGEILARALRELHNRDLNMLPTKDLIALINALEGKLIRDGASIEYVTDQRASVWDSIGGNADIKNLDYLTKVDRFLTSFSL